MNNDFEKAIREMMKSGKSMKEAMDALSATWDQIKKSDAEKSISEWRADTDTLFEEQWTHQHTKMDPEVIIKFLFYVLSHKHPEWSLKDIQNGVEAITNIVRIVEKAIGKDTIDMLGIMNRELDNLIGAALGKACEADSDSDSNKDQTKDKKWRSAPGKFFSISDNDAAALKDFFNLFGL